MQRNNNFTQNFNYFLIPNNSDWKKNILSLRSKTISNYLNLTLVKKTTYTLKLRRRTSNIKANSKQQSMGNNTHPLDPSGNLNSQDISTTFPRSCARFSHLPPPRMDESWRWQSASFVRACAVTRMNDRCAPFAKNRLVSGERTNRSYRVVPPRYPGTLFAASLLSLSSLSFENTRSTHIHTHKHRYTRCTIISRRDYYTLDPWPLR